MPRKKAAPPIEDIKLPGLEGIDHDRQPDAPPPRKRGRPAGSTTKATGGGIAFRSGTGKATSKAQVKSQVATELYGFATLFVGMWEYRDPCASVLTEYVEFDGRQTDRLAAIVQQTVEILSRSDKVLNALANAGMIGQLGMLAGLLYPVVRQVWSAHGPGGTGHGEEASEDGYQDRYPAPTLARA